MAVAAVDADCTIHFRLCCTRGEREIERERACGSMTVSLVVRHPPIQLIQDIAEAVYLLVVVIIPSLETTSFIGGTAFAFASLSASASLAVRMAIK